MKSFAILTGAAILAVGSAGLAAAQPISGTPSSPFPYAAPWEIQNGCRTILDRNSGTRIPVECLEPDETGSLVVVPRRMGPSGAYVEQPASGPFMQPYPAPFQR